MIGEGWCSFGGVGGVRAQSWSWKKMGKVAWLARVSGRVYGLAASECLMEEGIVTS